MLGEISCLSERKKMEESTMRYILHTVGTRRDDMVVWMRIVEAEYAGHLAALETTLTAPEPNAAEPFARMCAAMAELSRARIGLSVDFGNRDKKNPPTLSVPLRNGTLELALTYGSMNMKTVFLVSVSGQQEAVAAFVSKYRSLGGFALTWEPPLGGGK